MARVDKVQLRVRNVPLVGLPPFYREKWIVGSPDDEHARLFGPGSTRASGRKAQRSIDSYKVDRAERRRCPCDRERTGRTYRHPD